jgi:hypothetical protein
VVYRDRRRLSNDEPCSDLTLEEFVEFVYTLMYKADTAKAFIFHSGSVRCAFKQRLRIEPDRPSAGANYEIMDVILNSKDVKFCELNLLWKFIADFASAHLSFPYGKHMGR